MRPALLSVAIARNRSLSTSRAGVSAPRGLRVGLAGVCALLIAWASSWESAHTSARFLGFVLAFVLALVLVIASMGSAIGSNMAVMNSEMNHNSAVSCSVVSSFEASALSD